MSRRILSTAFIAGCALFMVTALSAQGPAPPARPAAMSVKVDVTLTRSQGDKKLSVLPFTLWGNTSSGWTNLRTGVDIPIGTTTETRNSSTQGSPSSTSTASTRPEYKNIGTSIDCRIDMNPGEEGRYYVQVNVSDSSIYSPEAARLADLASKGLVSTRTAASRSTDPTAFRTFSMSNRLPMRDGQTLEVATATDKISGETLKVEVTINVVK